MIVKCMLLSRLIYRKKYPLAQKICESLRLPVKEGEEKIVKQWALSKVTHIHRVNITDIIYVVLLSR